VYERAGLPHASCARLLIRTHLLGGTRKGGGAEKGQPLDSSAQGGRGRNQEGPQAGHGKERPEIAWKKCALSSCPETQKGMRGSKDTQSLNAARYAHVARHETDLGGVGVGSMNRFVASGRKDICAQRRTGRRGHDDTFISAAIGISTETEEY